MSNVYEDFLKICGFENEEIKKNLYEWQRASVKLGLTQEDIEFAINEWIPNNWDISLRGVRKLIGAFIREIIDLTKTNEYKKEGVKIVYGILPAILSNYMAIKLSGGDRVFIGFPDHFIVLVLNSFFHKAAPFLEIAEKNGMTYGCRHCALNKMRIAARMTNLIPSPDVIWTWGFICDEAPKTDEFINCYYDNNWKVIIARCPHDTYFGEIDDEIEERVKYIALQMKDGFENVEKMVGFKISTEDLFIATDMWRRYATKHAKLISLVSSSNPQLLGGNELSLSGAPLQNPFNTGIGYIEEAIDILLIELKEKGKSNKGIVPKDAPRLGCYFVPYTVPWISKIFEENEVGLTFSVSHTTTRKQLKPSKYKNPFMIAAEQWLRMPIASNLGYEVNSDIEKIKRWKPDAMLMGFYDFDRWLGAHQKILSKLVEKSTKVPHFYMEADFWDDRDYTPEALRTKIESISQVVKLNKMRDFV